ncbi:uncharacterized protein LOC144827304 [Lissotriton helveticus]
MKILLKRGQPGKGKLTFSDQELEILIEEVTERQEQLFGRLSLKVPEAVKRNIWLAIQAKVNAVGVAHRDINNLQKRWYDLSSCAKERLATRIKGAKITGGGTPRDRPNTPPPPEDMVEGTLLTEAVVVVTDIDTSEFPTPSEETLQEMIERDLRDFNTQDRQETDDGNTPTTSASLAQIGNRQRVRQLLQSESEEEHNENVSERQPQPTPTVSNTRMSRRRRLQQFFRRRAHVTDSGRFEEGTSTGSVVEEKILKVQRLQGKDIRIMKGKLGHISKQIGAMHNSMSRMITVIKSGHETSSEKLDHIATCLDTMCTVIQKQQNKSEKRHLRILTCMQEHNRQMSRFSNCAAQLCKQTLSLQLDMKKIYTEISKGMGKLHESIDKSNSNASPDNQHQIEDSGAGSTVSGILEHCVTGTRRSNRKNIDASNMHMLNLKNAGKALGVRGRKK